MKKKILYLILLLCAVAMPLGVRAYETDNSIKTAGFSGGNTGGNPSGVCPTTGSTFIPTFDYKGVRITVVDKFGNRVGGSGSIDFLYSSFRNYGLPIFYTSDKKSKIDLIKTPGNISNWFKEYKKGFTYTGTGMLLSDAGFNTSLKSLISSGNTKYDWSSVASELIDISKDSDELTTVLSKFGITYSDLAIDWYFLVEPLITIAASGEDNDKDGNCDVVGYALGTPSEFQRYFEYNQYFKFSGVTKGASHYIYYNYVYFDRIYFGGNGTASNYKSKFDGLKLENNSNVGLIWLGINVKTNTTCSKAVTNASKFPLSEVNKSKEIDSENDYNKNSYSGYYSSSYGYNPNYYVNSVCYSKPTCADVTKNYKYPSSSTARVEPEEYFIVSGSGYLGYSDTNVAYNPNYYINKVCYSEYSCYYATLNSSVKVSDAKALHGVSSFAAFNGWDKKSNYSGGYYKPNTGYDKNYYINSECYDEPVTTTCSAAVTNASKFPLGNNLKNKEISTKEQYGKDNYYNPDVGYHPNYYVNSNCYERPTCSDFYYNTRNFNKVSLWRDSETNCCIQYKNASGTDLNRLYRDHPECYSCRYSELSGTPTCSSSNNATTVGDSFEDVGDGNTQTCAYYVASGRVNSTSSNLVTRKTINSYCKVVCTETVNVKFPLFNHNYIQQGSYIVWPTNLVFKDESSRLVLHGTTNCWYYVDSVGLDQLGRSNKGMADTYLKQCATDFKNSYDNPTNVINYNLEGNFSVKYNDSEYGKNINLVKENNEAANYKRKNNLSSMNAINNATSGYRRDKLNNFVRAVEGITFEVTQSANYVIDSSSGYNYSYNGKWYSTYDEKWGNNTVKLEYAALGLKNDLYKGGKLEIDYSSIGGGSKKYSTTQKTYGTCEYCTVSAPLKECPAGTKNAGMNLTQIMEMESLSHEEAISKYCDSSLTVCPSGTYYAGSAVTEACLKDDNCKELTCNLYACTINNECKVLNYCISDQVEKYGKSFDEAKRYCENAYCGPGDNISDSIEYRVIDLKNPFPGVSAKFGVSIFNTNVAGRKPGQNWNSLNLVKKEILNNRGVSGDKVYSLEPLFEFNLTPSVIQRIRNYNDKNSYDDFTLKCKQNDKYACVASGFNIRSEDYGNVRTLAACQNISNLTNFNSCYNS